MSADPDVGSERPNHWSSHSPRVLSEYTHCLGCDGTAKIKNSRERSVRSRNRSWNPRSVVAILQDRAPFSIVGIHFSINAVAKGCNGLQHHCGSYVMDFNTSYLVLRPLLRLLFGLSLPWKSTGWEAADALLREGGSNSRSSWFGKLSVLS